MRLTNWSIQHRVTVFVLLIVIGFGGLLAYVSLPREASPDITIPYVMVTTPYIGVSPADIETLVTNPIEEELDQLKDVREIRSTSAEGASIISIEFEPGVDIDNALQLVRERVDTAEVELPEEAEETMITEISFSEFPIMVINISGDVGLIQLKTIAEDVQDRLERIAGVLEVNLIGGLEREITVQADPDLLEYYRVSLGELTQAIQNANINLPGGSVELGSLNYSVRVPGEFESVSEIEQIVIREVDGATITVRDVAEVVDGYEDQATYSRLDGVESVSLSITRRAGENIPRIAEEAAAIVDGFQQTYSDRVHFAILADVSEHIQDRIVELENNIITGLLLVAGVLLFFMGGLRNALFVAIAIPLSMLLSFAVLAALRVTLNIVVLFSLVLALGMLVDNAIVIVENIYRHATMGKSNAQAAKDAVAEVAWPVIASTATTVGAFSPLLFWPGIMGEFMRYLPLTVIVVLTSSLFVALVINPVICARFLKVKALPEGADPEDEFSSLPTNFLYRAYRAVLEFSLSHRLVIALIVLATFAGTFALYARFNRGQEFFPETTPETFYINVTLPDGSNLETSDAVVRAVEAMVQDEPNVQTVVADVGAGNGSQGDFGSGGTAPHRSRLTVELLRAENQVENGRATMARVREETQSLVGAEIEVVAEGMGPPSGPPINIEVVGDDYGQLGQIAQDATRVVREFNGVVNLSDDFESGRPEITVNVDRDASAVLGVTTLDVANTVRTAINGVTASVFRDQENEEHDIIVRLPEAQRNSLEDIERLMVKTRSGQYVRLTEVAEVSVERGFGSIRHLDGDRVVTVSAEVADGVNANALLGDVRERLGQTYTLPPGYELRYTGQNADQEEASAFLSKALLAALFIIALILVTQFNSVLQPGIILASVVLSLLGVLWILMIRQMPFNIIMTGVGVISLAGVVVNNAIVLIDYVNQLRARGLSVREALVGAGLVRLRPVLLTAVTTGLSLMPIVLGYSLNVTDLSITVGGTSVEMWGPMANAVVAGLAAATVLTLIVVPVMYSTFDSLHNLLYGRAERRARRRAERRAQAAEPRAGREWVQPQAQPVRKSPPVEAASATTKVEAA